MTAAGQGGRPRTVLRLANVTVRFGAVLALDDVSLTLGRGEIVALLGENGAGKTTLMNVLFGAYVPDRGTVEVDGRALPPGRPGAALAAGVGMVHQHFTLADDLSVLDNLLLGTRPLWSPRAGRAEGRARLARLARDHGLAVDPDRRAGDLSVGERQRVEILKALWRDVRVLVLDEPTAVLTPGEARALFATLRGASARGLSVVFISHKLHEVAALSDRVVVLRRGRVVAERATAALDADEMARLMVGGAIPAPEPRAGRPGATVAELRGVTTAGAPGLRDATLRVRAGEVVGIAGVAGNGQAALAALLGGVARPVSGTFLLHGAAPRRWSPREAVRAGVARIPEDRQREGSVADMTLVENAVLERHWAPPLSRGGWMRWGEARRFAARVLARHDVRGGGPDTPARLLSGGNMQKLVLGRALDGAPGLVVAVQPVRGLDVGALRSVHDALLAARDRGAGVVLVSDDLDEVVALSDVIHVVSGGRVSEPFARGEATPAALGRRMAGEGFHRAA